jgi:hypothetical protein
VIKPARNTLSTMPQQYCKIDPIYLPSPSHLLVSPNSPASLTNPQNIPFLSSNSLGVPNSFTCPASNTTIRSLSKIVLIRWAIVMIVRFEKTGLRSVAWRSVSVSTSTAAVASSRTRMLLGVRRARAREISWRWPEERLDPVWEGVC